ncbi:MAG: hypothetical protein R2867_06620 [Caldilineaceae bacterium]
MTNTVDTIDSDVNRLGIVVTVALTTTNNHTIDAGSGCGRLGWLPAPGSLPEFGELQHRPERHRWSSHVIIPGIYMGSTVDAEITGQDNATATGDDTAGTPR